MRRSGRAVALVWLLTRGIVLATLLWVCVTQHHSPGWSMQAWDTGHFVRISQQAYQQRDEVAFFPGLPVLMHLGSSLGVAPWLTGGLLSLICSALAAWALFRLGGAMAATWWLLAPMTVFTVVPYTEAPFAACAFWAWERARAGRWWQAALLAALGSCFRISGIFLVGGLGVLALFTHGRRWSRLVVLVVPAGVTLAYFVYLHHLTGDWQAWSHAQSIGWHRSGFSTPWASLRRTLAATHRSAWPSVAPHRYKYLLYRVEIASVVVGTVTVVYCLVRRWWAEAAYVAVQLLAFTTSFVWMSVCRAVLLWFPFFLMLASLSSRRPRRDIGRAARLVFWTLLGLVMCALMVPWSWLFFTRQWAG